MGRLRSFEVSDNKNVMLIEDMAPAYGTKRWYFERRHPKTRKLTLSEGTYDSKRSAMKEWKDERVYF